MSAHVAAWVRLVAATARVAVAMPQPCGADEGTEALTL